MKGFKNDMIIDNNSNDNVFDKICIICGKNNCNGILILGKKICSECEEKAVNSDVTSEFYEFYKKRISEKVVGKLKKLG